MEAPTQFDVIVLGGGIIGALSAFELSKSGIKVALVDKNKFRAGASGSSAAMLEHQLDAHRGEPFFSLAKASAALFPSLAEDIKNSSGIDIQYEKCGILQLARTPEEASHLSAEVQRQKKLGLRTEWKTPADIAKDYPDLTRDHLGGAYYAEDGQVNGGKFLDGALESARKSGARLVESMGEYEFIFSSGKAAGIRNQNETLLAPVIVAAAGAWTDELLKPFHIRLGIEPVKGQLAVYETPPLMFPYPVYTTKDGYITPKRDGTTLAGTTVEFCGFDAAPTEEGKRKIRDHAVFLSDRFKQLPLRKMIAGLRPKSQTNLPVIGWLPGHSNFLVAAGHYRNGILLSPITAKVVASLIRKKSPPVDITPLQPTPLVSSL